MAGRFKAARCACLPRVLAGIFQLPVLCLTDGRERGRELCGYQHKRQPSVPALPAHAPREGSAGEREVSSTHRIHQGWPRAALAAWVSTVTIMARHGAGSRLWEGKLAPPSSPGEPPGKHPVSLVGTSRDGCPSPTVG